MSAQGLILGLPSMQSCERSFSALHKPPGLYFGIADQTYQGMKHMCFVFETGRPGTPDLPVSAS